MTDLPGPLTGNNPLAIWLNKLRSFVVSCGLRPGVGYKLKRGALGTVLEIEPSLGGGGRIAAFKFQSMATDYIVCHTWDGTNEGSANVNVYKPQKLSFSITSETIDGVAVAYSSYDATAQTRVATSESITETQVIVPRYLLGDVILAFQWSGQWVEINNNARAWMAT